MATRGRRLRKNIEKLKAERREEMKIEKQEYTPNKEVKSCRRTPGQTYRRDEES